MFFNDNVTVTSKILMIIRRAKFRCVLCLNLEMMLCNKTIITTATLTPLKINYKNNCNNINKEYLLNVIQELWLERYKTVLVSEYISVNYSL